LSHVALVLGRGRSQEEVKLGEALGLAYLDAALRKSRPDVGISLINAIIDPELRGCRDDDLTDARVAARRVAAAGPILCGVSLVYRGQHDWTAVFAATLKQLAPGCHIVVGGMWPTSAWELLLGSIPQVDSICIGEGDRVILRLLDALESGGAWRAIAELAVRGEDGTPVAGGRTAAQLGLRRPPVVARVPAAELGDLEFPTRGQLDTVLALGGVIQVEASRGCNAGHLVAELKLLADRYPGALVYMVDNIFLGFSTDGSHLVRGREIAREIIAQGIDVRFVIQDRAANVDRQTFALLKEAGLCEVYLGIESFADSALLAMGKGSDASAEGNRRALRLLGELEIYTQFGFLPFHEKATFDELRTSLRGLRDACLDNPYLHVSNFNELIPYEGTYLARRYQRDHGELPPATDPWRYADDRVWFVRDWMWRFSVALWPVTGLVFNAIQRPDFQRDLWRTLPAKNHAYVSWAEELLRLADDGADFDGAAYRYRLAVADAVHAIAGTLRDWPPSPAKAEMQAGLARVDAEQAIDLVGSRR
jgi:radical SAM superfamily enzyme YgiQ (UPF0313 family)